MKLSLSQSDASATPWLDQSVTGALASIAESLGHDAAAIDLIVVDDTYIQGINRDYRGKDRPTDVISFSYLEEVAAQKTQDDLAGEIYVSYETLEKEAKSQGVQPQDLFLRLGVHGLLHVVGYDHQTDDETERMEAEERRLLLDHLPAGQVEELF